MSKVHRTVPRRSTGFVAEGTGFYVWDEDREALERFAAELASAERLGSARRGLGGHGERSRRLVVSARKPGKPPAQR